MFDGAASVVLDRLPQEGDGAALGGEDTEAEGREEIGGDDDTEAECDDLIGGDDEEIGDDDDDNEDGDSFPSYITAARYLDGRPDGRFHCGGAV